MIFKGFPNCSPDETTGLAIIRGYIKSFTKIFSGSTKRQINFFNSSITCGICRAKFRAVFKLSWWGTARYLGCMAWVRLPCILWFSVFAEGQILKELWNSCPHHLDFLLSLFQLDIYLRHLQSGGQFLFCRCRGSNTGLNLCPHCNSFWWFQRLQMFQRMNLPLRHLQGFQHLASDINRLQGLYPKNKLLVFLRACSWYSLPTERKDRIIRGAFDKCLF